MATQEEIMQNLLDITKKQSDNISTLSTTVGSLFTQMGSKSSKKTSFGFSLIMTALTLIVVVMMFFGLQTTNNAINGCTNPTGKCAQQTLANNAVNRGQIICNQEKVLYFVRPDSYKPLPFCIDVINAEIDRAAAGTPGKTPRLTVPKNTDQIPTLQTTFIDKRDGK